ncbi:MAG TPA: hypothetical protein VHB48_00370 [Chitinophagaceae bacterium]|nr:hypothetical protein [Chitinophagaceae bacterium]
MKNHESLVSKRKDSLPDGNMITSPNYFSLNLDAFALPQKVNDCLNSLIFAIFNYPMSKYEKRRGY